MIKRTARAEQNIRVDMAAPSEIKPLSIIWIAATAAGIVCGVYKKTTAEMVVKAEAKR